MKIARIVYTRGDATTLPGGIIVRRRGDGEYIVHYFNRDRGSKKPTDYHQGSYLDNAKKANIEFARRLASRAEFVRGGSIIDDCDLDDELKAELEVDIRPMGVGDGIIPDWGSD